MPSLPTAQWPSLMFPSPRRLPPRLSLLKLLGERLAKYLALWDFPPT